MGQKWYIDKIKVAAPELLDGDTADIMDWIDNAFAIYAEDEDTAAKMDDAIKEQEDYYGVEIDYMSRTQLLTVVAKLIDVTGGRIIETATASMMLRHTHKSSLWTSNGAKKKPSIIRRITSAAVSKLSTPSKRGGLAFISATWSNMSPAPGTRQKTACKTSKKPHGILTGDLVFINGKSGALVVPTGKGWLEKDEQTQSVMDFECIHI